MADERTYGELADVLDHEVRNRRDAPESYDEGLTDLYGEAARRLQEMDKGIEGWAWVDDEEEPHLYEFCTEQSPTNDRPATLIIGEPQGQEND